MSNIKYHPAIDEPIEIKGRYYKKWKEGKSTRLPCVCDDATGILRECCEILLQSRDARLWGKI